MGFQGRDRGGVAMGGVEESGEGDFIAREDLVGYRLPFGFEAVTR